MFKILFIRYWQRKLRKATAMLALLDEFDEAGVDFDAQHRQVLNPQMRRQDSIATIVRARHRLEELGCDVGPAPVMNPLSRWYEEAPTSLHYEIQRCIKSTDRTLERLRKSSEETQRILTESKKFRETLDNNNSNG